MQIVFVLKHKRVCTMKKCMVSMATFNEILEHGSVQNWSYRLLARGSIAPPPLGNFADIPYLKEQFKLSKIRDVCTLSVGALSCNSLLHTLPKQN